jgi:NodT family efflux transporter outer membrane factor (OMF) lipoprotein
MEPEMKTRNKVLQLTSIAAAGLLSCACAVGPDYQRPALPTGDAYPATAIAANGSAQSQALHSGMDIPAQWWEVFHSREVSDLVTEALQQSPTLEAARAALLSARELRIVQAGAYYPTVNANIEPTRQKIANTLASPAASGDDLYSLTTAQLSVSYTPDVFGANARAVEASRAQEMAQRYELEAARLTLAAGVVNAVILDAQLRAQLDAVKQVLAGQKLTLTSFELQYQLGQVSQADLAAQQSLLAQAEAALPPLEKQWRINRDLLAVLLGRTPGNAPDVKVTLRELELPHDLPLSLPARLVEQRPDVLLAEAQLQAASAQVGVAKAARLPNLNISASAGNAAVHIGDLFSGPTTFWNLAANLTQPIFAGGTLEHKQYAAEASYQQAAAQYRGSVLTALQNVADTLHAIQTDANALHAAERAEQASAHSLKMARRQFQLGDISSLAVIAAEQSYAQAQSALVQAQANRYSDTVALFQALGGGWWHLPAEPEK